MCDGADATKVIDGERVQEDVLLVEGMNVLLASGWPAAPGSGMIVAS